MARKQTRRTLSLSRAMYEAIKARAAARNMSASQYMHDLAAQEMAAAGVTPPEHVSPHEPHNVRAVKQERNDTATDEDAQRRLAALKRIEIDQIAEARKLAAGVTGRSVLRQLPQGPESAEVIEAKLDGRRLPLMPRLCAWCEQRATSVRPFVADERGVMHHADCLAERVRVETRAAERARTA